MTNSTDSRVLTLLGQGLGAEVVASAIGISPSRVSQLLSDATFAAQVAELRFQNLAKHNERDSSYDALEDKLLEKMRDLLPFMMKPMEVLKAISIINAAKRRGSSTPESIIGQQTVVQLVMPTQIINNFTAQKIETNINNQVVRAGQTDLITVQSSAMNQLLSRSKSLQIENVRESHDVQTSIPTPSTTT